MMKNFQSLQKFYAEIFDSSFTHKGKLYGMTLYQMKSNATMPLKKLVNRLNEVERYGSRNKKYYILTPKEANSFNPKIKQLNCFYTCYVEGRYIKISSNLL